MVKPSPLDFGYAGRYLREYETFHYTFLERNLFWLDEVRNILVPPDAEEFADVAFYQAGMNWDKYAQHARAVFLRIGQNTWKDPEFETNYTEARRRNLALGGYFFFDGRATPNQQANTIINAMVGKHFEMELIIDWERNYGGASEGLPNVVKLMQLCEAAGIQCKAVGQYTGYYWFTDNSNATTHAAEYAYLKMHPLWLAWYGAALLVKVPLPWADWTHWQYGTIAEDWGQPTEELDRNKHNGTRAKFTERYLGGIIPPPPIGDPMDKFMKVTDKVTSSLNIRSSGADLGTQNDLGPFNLLCGDIIHVVEANTNYYCRFDALYRGGVAVTLPASPTNQYWALEKSSVGIWLADTVFVPPVPTVTDVDIHLAKGSTVTRKYSDGTQKVETA